MIAYAIGRIGCLLNGCCYGAPTNMPWGMRFFDDGHWTPPSHPTQLYASLLSLVFFAGLVWLEKRQTYRGQIACWYLLGTATERFLMEIWRAGTTSDVVRVGPIHFLTDVQWLCFAHCRCRPDRHGRLSPQVSPSARRAACARLPMEAAAR